VTVVLLSWFELLLLLSVTELPGPFAEPVLSAAATPVPTESASAAASKTIVRFMESPCRWCERLPEQDAPH
jgi:hypothetical protein